MCKQMINIKKNYYSQTGFVRNICEQMSSNKSFKNKVTNKLFANKLYIKM